MFLSAIADNQDHVDLILPEPMDVIKVTCLHVMADIQPSSLLTMYLSGDDSNFVTGHVYNNDGFSHWPAEPNVQFTPQPYTLGYPQSLNLGCRIGIDVGERDRIGLNVNAEIRSFGSIAGQPVVPVYQCRGNVGFIGGLAGISTKPDYLGGGVWFPESPQGTPFDWSASFGYGGHCDVPGMRVKAIRFTMDGGGTFGRKIKQGVFIVEAFNLSEMINPTPGVEFTAIGDFNASHLALDGNTSKPSTECAFKGSSISGWIGKTGDIPWQAPQFRVFGSNNDGFTLGGAPQPTVTASLYESDSVPAHSTDGTLVETKNITDADGLPGVTFTLTSGEKLSRWVVLSHTRSATSMYVAAVG